MWKEKKNYLVRTVTMTICGKLEKVGKKELLFSSASWIADTGRFTDALKDGVDTLSSSEIEVFQDDVLVGRGAIVDATIYRHKLPRAQK